LGKLSLRFLNFVELFSDMDRQTDCAAFFGNGAGNGLANPPKGIG